MLYIIRLIHDTGITMIYGAEAWVCMSEWMSVCE